MEEGGDTDVCVFSSVNLKEGGISHYVYYLLHVFVFLSFLI